MSESEELKQPGKRSAATSLNDLLPLWKCHKVVRAAKIASVRAETAGRINLTLVGIEMSWATDYGWFEKHQPKAGGYLVLYEDGYTSYSPAHAFEDGYTRVYP